MKKNPLKQKRYFCLCIVLPAMMFLQSNLFTLENGLARTPPMGWNSWNHFKSFMDEKTAKQIADAMVSSGMRDAGYVYLILDDTWMNSGRDKDGNLVPEPLKFPDGLRSLADYIHSKGLLFGIYGDRGKATCAGGWETGSYGHEQQDATWWASQGVDYLKYDNCNPVGDLQAEYELMRDCLVSSGRPIVFSMCSWGWTGEWMIDCGNLWRTTGDISDCWDDTCDTKKKWETGMTNNIDSNALLYKYAGPGHWNDPDMLEVGNGGMSTIEYKSHFSMWCIMAAPLISGNDVRKMSRDTKLILCNTEAIAVDQDPAGIQGRRIRKEGDLEVWLKPLGSENSTEKAVVLFNRSAKPSAMNVTWKEIGLSGSALVRGLWEHKTFGSFNDSFGSTVEPHGVAMLKITGNAK